MAESLGTSVLDLTTDDSGLRSGLESAKSTVKVMGLAIGAAAAAAITAGAVEGLQREALTDHLAAQLDLTGEESARAGRIAGALYADAYGDSLEQVNAALAGVHANIGELGSFSDAEITDMGAKALDLAKIMGEDVARVTRGVGQLMRNDMAPNAQAAFDMIFAAQSKVGADMKGELLDTIEEYSADFSSLGLNGEQALGMITAAVQAGARNTDLAADAVREFSIRAVDGSVLTAEGFTRLGLNADAMAQKIAAGGPTAQAAMSEVIRALGGVGDKVAQEQIGVALFGTRFEEMGITAIQAMDPVAAGLDNVDGAADRMGDTLNDNAQTKIDGFRRSIEGALAKVVEAPGILGSAAAAVAGFGQVLAPVGPALTGVAVIFGNQIKGMVAKAASGSASIVASMARASASTAASAARMAASAAASGASMVASMAKAGAASAVQVARMVAGWVLLSIQSLLHAATVALAWLIAMGPIALVIAAVIGLVALIIANWDKIKAAISAAWEFVRRVTRAFWDWLKNTINDRVQFVRAVISAAWDKIKSTISGAWESVKERTRSFVDGLKTAISNGISAVVNFFRELPGKILSAVGNLNRLLADKAAELIGGFIDGIKRKFADVKRTLGNLTDLLPDWKGPRRVDIRLLAKPAEWIMEGFADSLSAEAARLVQPALMGISTDLQAAFMGDGVAAGGLNIENINVHAFSDRFSLMQVQRELSTHGAL